MGGGGEGQWGDSSKHFQLSHHIWRGGEEVEVNKKAAMLWNFQLGTNQHMKGRIKSHGH